MHLCVFNLTFSESSVFAVTVAWLYVPQYRACCYYVDCSVGALTLRMLTRLVSIETREKISISIIIFLVICRELQNNGMQ